MPGNIYCGNNRNNPKVVNGQQRIGTKYTCLRAGIGVGKNLPYDPSYLNEYIPIDNRRIYCGTHRLPENYDYSGSLRECYTIGVGVGKRLKALEGPRRRGRYNFDPNGSKNIISGVYFQNIIILFCFYIISSLIVYFLKPKILTKQNKDKSILIDFKKFSLFLIIYALFLIILAYTFGTEFATRT